MFTITKEGDAITYMSIINVDVDMKDVDVEDVTNESMASVLPLSYDAEINVSSERRFLDRNSRLAI